MSAPRRIGPYRIVRDLGSGGMGTVYLAERADGSFEASVALKVLRPSLVGTDLAARFRRERQILAELSHPGIARLLDGGQSEEGVPYLVMEFVNGTPIDAFVQASGLDVEARLRLFLKVCDAVRHAHARLIVHTDLKQHRRRRTGAPHPSGLRHREARRRAGHRSGIGLSRHGATAPDPGLFEPGADPGGAHRDLDGRVLAGRAAVRAPHGGAPLPG